MKLRMNIIIEIISVEKPIYVKIFSFLYLLRILVLAVPLIFDLI